MTAQVEDPSIGQFATERQDSICFSTICASARSAWWIGGVERDMEREFVWERKWRGREADFINIKSAAF